MRTAVLASFRNAGAVDSEAWYTSAVAGGRMTWKLEQPSTSTSRNDDVGPAWVDPDGGPYPSGPVLGGRWIRRREARAIAEEHGLALFEDDGTAVADAAPRDPRRARLDVDAVNRKLRTVGVSASELRLEKTPGWDDVLVWGSMVQLLPGRERDPESPYTTAMVSMSEVEALDALDQLVPGWRSVE